MLECFTVCFTFHAKVFPPYPDKASVGGMMPPEKPDTEPVVSDAFSQDNPLKEQKNGTSN
jgi:hypothetical protein